MSGIYTRTQIKNFITTNFPNDKVVDLSAAYDDISSLLKKKGIGVDDTWIGLQFIGNSEAPISLTASNNSGTYREIGLIILHIVVPVQIDVLDDILAKGEEYIDAFRGQRIGNILIEEVSPINTAQGTTLEFQSGYTSGSININYHTDKHLT